MSYKGCCVIRETEDESITNFCSLMLSIVYDKPIINENRSNYNETIGRIYSIHGVNKTSLRCLSSNQPEVIIKYNLIRIPINIFNFYYKRNKLNDLFKELDVDIQIKFNTPI